MCSSKMKPRLRAEWVVASEELCILASTVAYEQEFCLGKVESWQSSKKRSAVEYFEG